MKRYRGRVIFAALWVLFAAALVWLANDNGAAAPRVQLAVVVYGESAERWSGLDQGIQQACNELGIEKPVIALTRASDPEEQMRLIRREVQNGAEGLLVAPCDSAAMQPFLEELAAQMPVVLLETGAGDALPCVAADDAAMGRALAGSLAGSENVVVVAQNLVRESVRLRYDAFVQAMADAGREVRVWRLGDDRVGNARFVADNLSRSLTSAVVTFDDEATQTVAGAVAAGARRTEVYGMGSSAQVVYALDTGLVTELCFQNEFSIGYIGTMRLAGQFGLKVPATTAEVEYRLVRLENMYTPEAERLLFPVIQ